MNQIKETGCRSYQGGYFRILICPDQTNDALAIIEFTLPKGAEPPPHIHTNEDEVFYVLDGEICVTLDGRRTVLEKGAALFAPRKVLHSFTILTEQATFINLITPGTLWNYFMEFSSPLTELPGAIAVAADRSADRIEAMIDVITNKYQVFFSPPKTV